LFLRRSPRMLLVVGWVTSVLDAPRIRTLGVRQKPALSALYQRVSEQSGLPGGAAGV
jgi:hypothetical protein